MKTIRRRFDSLEEARQYADHVNKTLRRKAAVVAEISGIECNQSRPAWTGSYDKMLQDMTVRKYFEVCFDTRSDKF